MGLIFGRLDTALLAGPTPKRLRDRRGRAQRDRLLLREPGSLGGQRARDGVLLLLFLWAAQLVRRSSAEPSPGPRSESAFRGRDGLVVARRAPMPSA